jgi:hypothetical protein
MSEPERLNERTLKKFSYFTVEAAQVVAGPGSEDAHIMSAQEIIGPAMMLAEHSRKCLAQLPLEGEEDPFGPHLWTASFLSHKAASESVEKLSGYLRGPLSGWPSSPEEADLKLANCHWANLSLNQNAATYKLKAVVKRLSEWFEQSWDSEETTTPILPRELWQQFEAAVGMLGDSLAEVDEGDKVTHQARKTPGPAAKPGRTVPKGKILLGQTLQFDWLTYKELGNPDDENEDYNDWRIDRLSGDFELSLGEAKHWRRWFQYTHCKRHPTDAPKLDKEIELSDGDKAAITDWLKSQRKGKK